MTPGLAPETTSLWRLLVELDRAERRRVRAGQDVERMALQARRAGASWGQIATVLGVTPQAVLKRFGPKVSA